jgi:hypothetical protein
MRTLHFAAGGLPILRHWAGRNPECRDGDSSGTVYIRWAPIVLGHVGASS